ncbi:hypothetical protein X793_05590 [Dehalococcoides mccartyi CG4]|uniref:hypothetical protein n=1 Tax=Dehalococcoides mccartyi TaxID=61435 RepID=UPI0004E07D28|nr:hypothetical protein [Dehalococcoides mccartyi]AII60222.1 hypothetical protein X793_05590 [Dehalococcoides mccartyi CG4]
MDNSVYIVIGLLLGMLFALASTLLLLIPSMKPKTKSTLPIEILKQRIHEINAELQEVAQQLWIYGVEQEEENKKWRRIYRDFTSKTIDTLHSCWIGRNDDITAKATYDELVTGLKTIGIEEILPNVGEIINEDDDSISIRVIKGDTPFRVIKLVYPGYQLNSRHLKTKIILSPSVVEVIGQN